MDRTMEKRLTPLNDRQPRTDGRCVMYWMQSSLRAQDNPALDFAAMEANRRNVPLLVFFSIDPSIPSGNTRNFTFMLESLKSLEKSMELAGASFCVRAGDAVDNMSRVAADAAAALVVTDESHLNEGKRRREQAAQKVRVPLVQADANVIVPVRAIPGEQYAAYTIRPKLHRLMGIYLAQGPAVKLRSHRDITLDRIDIDVSRILRWLKLPRVPASFTYHGGEQAALETLSRFLEDKLDEYDVRRNDPSLNGTSDLSPYLRFGNISPVRIVNETMASGAPQPDVDAFVEQAFVRRELAENFTFYNPGYRSLASLPDWARKTLEAHAGDGRPRLFTLKELEEGRTGDELWDASQIEMLKTGKMAGYMRMVWGKMVMQWTASHEEALRVLLYLNDKYELDGRSPNGYAGIMWCFGKHDRAFSERPIYGKLRYMTTASTAKKFSVTAYMKKAGYAPGLKAY